WVGIDHFPGMGWVIFALGLAVGLLANFLVMWWMIVILPRTKVPLKSGVKGALLGAVALEVIKQLSTVIMSSATGNPAGAVFGPVIVLMIMMYLIWRVVMYISAWTATTEESLALEEPSVPEPAVIRVRQEISSGPSAGTTFGVGAAIGAIGAVAVALLRRKYRLDERCGLEARSRSVCRAAVSGRGRDWGQWSYLCAKSYLLVDGVTGYSRAYEAPLCSLPVQAHAAW